jgi:hypothetical protein
MRRTGAGTSPHSWRPSSSRPSAIGGWSCSLAAPAGVGSNSHKLLGDLDPQYRQCVGEVAPAGLQGDGLFYSFYDAPRVVPAASAGLVAGSRDALFLLVPGELAVYFFHEGTVWLCRA